MSSPKISITSTSVAVNGLPQGGTSGQILAKIDDTDFNTQWIENYADYTSVVKHRVKAGENLNKGQPVYVTAVDNSSTNMIVSLANNTLETKSSKTMGLMAQNLSKNGFGFVVTEGLLSGLNTNGATAGDPVWLGSNGALIYGLSSKPVAPAHLVFLGIVTRAHAINGEIFVKVQNGFELNEIHDLVLTNLQNGDSIIYDSATGKWKNSVVAGTPGPQGATGPAGPKGDTGLTGPQGLKGDKGDTGAAGANGLDGATGPAGPKGDTGLTGPAGADGAAGPQGLKGDKGDTGATGAAGPGIAVGGTAGQYLTKVNGTDYNTQWSTLDLSTYQSKVTNVSDTEIGYLDGVTSAIQTQLNNKINTTGTNTISLTTTNESDPLTIQSKNGHGGAGFAGILTVENTTSGTTNSKKFIRMNSTGGIEVVNNGYTATIFSIADNGDLGGIRNITTTGSINNVNLNANAWDTYTPSLSTESGTWNIGNGSIVGAWKLIGRTCHFRLKITFGSTTSVGAGTLNISLPTQAASSTYQFPVSILDNGNAWYEATANGDYLGSTTKFAMICNSGGSSKSSEGVTATAPFTFGSGDSISISGSYEIS